MLARINYEPGSTRDCCYLPYYNGIIHILVHHADYQECKHVPPCGRRLRTLIPRTYIQHCSTASNGITAEEANKEKSSFLFDSEVVRPIKFYFWRSLFSFQMRLGIRKSNNRAGSRPPPIQTILSYHYTPSSQQHRLPI